MAVALLAALFAMNVGGWRERLLGGAPRIRSLAVLPLANLSGDPQQEYFADGMTEALINDLCKIAELRVISRTSVMQYKGARKALSLIARELQVDAVVEGSVLRSGDRVRISTQLIQAGKERQMWAESYERDLRDVLVLQGEMARTIASAIRTQLTPEDQTRLASARPVNPEAYEAVLMGRAADGRTKSLDYFRRAIEIDPKFALGYAALADCYWGMALFSEISPREAAPLALDAAATAV